MTPEASRIAALAAEIARLEGSMADGVQALAELRGELAALQAGPGAADIRHPVPSAAADTQPATPRGLHPDSDPDGDLFDDVPV